MRIRRPPAAVGAAIVNPNNTYQTLGQGAVGSGVAITAGNATKGSFFTIGDTVSAWSGFWVFAYASTSNTRYLIDLYVGANGSEVLFAANIYMEPTTVGLGFASVFLPLNVPSGTHIRAKVQGSGAGTLDVWVRGIVTDANSDPMFNTMTMLSTVDLTNTRPSSADIAMVGSGSTAFSTILDPTAATYGAILAIMGGNSGGAVTTSQMGLLNVATGAAASEAVIGTGPVAASAASTNSFRPTPAMLLYKTISAGVRLSAQMISATAQGANDKFTLGLYGFS